MEADTSTLRKTGHFYFALTRIQVREKACGPLSAYQGACVYQLSSTCRYFASPFVSVR